ncbi:MAG: energy-coupled thiamine transporter ThiT [Bacilli bacterium]|nr:energy-coupled thiamine transporter ThiT [Bacilli bacterium]
MSLKFTIKEITEAALLIALAVVLGYFEIPLPLGGVTLALVPVFLIALRNTPLKTFIFVGIVYGLIDCLLDGYGFMTFPLEYLVALGSSFIVSLFRTKLFNHEKNVGIEITYVVISVLIVTIIRFICSTIDGVLIYEATFVESMTLNAPNIFLDGGFTLVVLLLIYFPLRQLNVNRYLEK